MAVDPVCGMTVDPARTAGRVEHEGTTYYFCSTGCVAKFTADPKKYLSGEREPMQPQVLSIGGLEKPHPRGSAEHPRASAEYTCPMHPEVISDRPGACPTYGIALEP